MILTSALSATFAFEVACGEEVQWRRNYADARAEATSKDKLIVLAFGSEDCHWCKRLETETLRDPAVLALLREKFVTYKVDAQRDARLMTALNIQSYPTLVFAASDGKILGVQEGYVEAARFRDQLQRFAALQASSDPIARAYDDAAKAIAASDFARAISLLKEVVQDGKERPVQIKARTLLQEIEQQATERLASARRLADQGLKTEAIAAARDVNRAYAGSQAAREAAPLLAEWSTGAETQGEPRARRAQELLALAREDWRVRRYLACLDRCEQITTNYADLTEGSEAARLAVEIKNNPEWMQQACDQLEERLAAQLLTLAESQLRKGQTRQATACLERVIQVWPGTRQAEAARARLRQIQVGSPATETRKP
jgi:thioredoxin-related protein